MSFFNVRQVKKTQRSGRRCQWCEQLILAGQPSSNVAGVFEGDFFTARFHPECYAATSRWYKANDCWGDPWPSEPMNRGGIRPRGEEETP